MENVIRKHKAPIIASCVAVAIGVSWLGFDTTYAKVMSCTVTSKAWVTAEYSETSTTVDGNGNVSLDTDYWSEPASEVFKVVTYDGELGTQYGNFEPIRTGRSYYRPPVPAWEGSMAKDPDFDNFQKHQETSLEVLVHLTVEDEANAFTDSPSKNPKCIDKISNYIQVKTWYGITYASDF